MPLSAKDKMLRYVCVPPSLLAANMRSMGTKVVAVRVEMDPLHEDFTVHENLIHKSSGFFETCLSDNSRDPYGRIVKLPAYEPEDFMIYNQWLYSGRLHMTVNNEDKTLLEVQSLIKGYILGHFLDDVKYMDTLIDTLIKWATKARSSDCSFLVLLLGIAVYKKTDKTCPLRRYLIDITVWQTSHSFWTKNHHIFSNELVADVSVGYSARCNHWEEFSTCGNCEEVIPFARPGVQCTYHCHGDKPCSITKPMN
jgi:hypothetical protein